MELRAPEQMEHPRLQALLIDSGLPVDDLETAAVDFIVAVDDSGLSGVVGLQTFEGIGLLRSLAVRPGARGAGVGRALVDALESRARATGVRQLVLLTQTAAPFFSKRGYVEIARGSAPAEVQISQEFRSICPASAICMTKQIGAPP